MKNTTTTTKPQPLPRVLSDKALESLFAGLGADPNEPETIARMIGLAQAILWQACFHGRGTDTPGRELTDALYAELNEYCDIGEYDPDELPEGLAFVKFYEQNRAAGPVHLRQGFWPAFVDKSE